MILADKSPIADFIVFNLIREVHFEKFRFSKVETLDSQIIPTISDSILLNRGFQESSYISPSLPPIVLPPFGITNGITKSKKTSEPAKPIIRAEPFPGFQESILEKETLNLPKPFEKNSLHEDKSNVNYIKKISPPPAQASPIVSINLFQNPPNYGKLNPLIKDPFVEYIDCPGPFQKILVVRNGQKQQTNITLSKEEISMLLNNVSSKTKIPIIPGVFRVSWDNFVLNAPISEVLPPRFVLKKWR
jgi:hypothetical protein